MRTLSTQLQHQTICTVAFRFSVRWDRILTTCWTLLHIFYLHLDLNTSFDQPLVIKSRCHYCSGTKKAHRCNGTIAWKKKMLFKSQEQAVFSFNILSWKKNDLTICILTSRLCFQASFCSMYGFTQEMPVKPDLITWFLQKVPINAVNSSDATLQLSRASDPAHKTHIRQSLSTWES